MEEQKTPDEKILLLKAERFCAYRERCGQEIKQKMKELGADEKITEKIISLLIEDDFLNDERFAKLFTSGKFRIKRWGKNKIRAALRMKKISDDFISNALDAIDEEEYRKTILHLISKKKKQILSSSERSPSDKSLRKESFGQVPSDKLIRYLLSKGFELGIVMQVLKGDSSLRSE